MVEPRLKGHLEWTGESGGSGEQPLCSRLLLTLAGRDGVWNVRAYTQCEDAGV